MTPLPWPRSEVGVRLNKIQESGFFVIQTCNSFSESLTLSDSVVYFQLIRINSILGVYDDIKVNPDSWIANVLYKLLDPGNPLSSNMKLNQDNLYTVD